MATKQIKHLRQAQRLRWCRHRILRLTQATLANYLGISTTQYRNYEVGISYMPYHRLAKFRDLYAASQPGVWSDRMLFAKGAWEQVDF